MLYALMPQGHPTRSNALVGKGSEYLSGVHRGKGGDVQDYRIEMYTNINLFHAQHIPEVGKQAHSAMPGDTVLTIKFLLQILLPLRLLL